MLLALSLVFSSLSCYCQGALNVKILNEAETDSVFSVPVRSSLGIRYPIYKVYQLADKRGNHYLVLTEKKHGDGPTSLNDTIQGFAVLSENGKLQVEWSLLDFILKEGNQVSGEYSIWFWTKYIAPEDIDGDGLFDPVIVYGSSGRNGIDDGRIKIVVYCKGAKRVIRHQNGTLDFERNTQVDQLFYQLPASVREYVQALMEKMEANNHAIFPGEWEAAMKKQQLRFDER